MLDLDERVAELERKVAGLQDALAPRSDRWHLTLSQIARGSHGRSDDSRSQ
jgi:hypothetical protein